jgi:hypothetical protein
LPSLMCGDDSARSLLKSACSRNALSIPNRSRRVGSSGVLRSKETVWL